MGHDSSTRDETLSTADLRRVTATGSLRLIVSASTGISVVPLPQKSHVILGRSADADVVVEDPSVSRHHAGLEISDRVELIDLGSRHGTRLLGRPVSTTESTVLNPGTAFEIGGVTVLLDSYAATSAETQRRGGTDTPNVIVVDPAMKQIWNLLDVVGPSHLSVLILGETGTGKEVFAEAVVRASTRADGPLVKVNCAALSPALLESELFGHERGAFTGADKAKNGLIEAADGGTLFLDEVGELPIELQAKLLRVVEVGEVMRVGSVKPRRVDVRYVSATNVPLEEAVAARRFRADLLFRLNGFTLRLPALRERPADIIPLTEGFIRRAAQRLGTVTPALSAEARASIQRYEFPGNVRELKNLVERAIALARGAAELTPAHILLDGELTKVAEDAGTSHGASSLQESVASHERDRIVDALQDTGGNQTEAAKLLQISRRTLINKIEQYGIPRPRKRE